MIAHSDLVTQAARRVLSLSCYIQADESDLNEPGPLQSDIVALISLVGDLDWTLMLALPKSTAEALAAKFAGFPIPFGTPDMGDAIGELANILGGTVKALLDERGVRADISLPSVMSGQNINVLGQKSSEVFESHLDSPAGHICIGVIADRSRSTVCN